MPKTPTSKGNQTRARIVAAARQKLIDQGVDAFALRELANSLDLKLGNLQYYFKTREALILEVLQQEATDDIDLIRANQARSQTAQDALNAMVRDLVVRWRGDSGVLMSALGTLALHKTDFRRLHRSIYAVFYEALEMPLRAFNPVLGDAEIQLRVRLITALIDGSSMQTQIGDVDDFLDRVQQQAELIALAGTTV